MRTMNDIQSLHRAFAILNIISQEPHAARSGTIAERVGLPKTTVLRMLNTLENIGAIVRDPAAGHYRIGSVILTLAYPKPTHQQLIDLAKSHLLQLANRTGETVYLCVQSGDQVHYIDQIDAQHHILLRNWVGVSFPLHTTAPGKLFLALWDDEKIEEYLKRPLEKYTERTIVEPEKIRDYILDIRDKQVAWTHGQTEIELVGVAAPIYTTLGTLAGALAVGGPSFRFPGQGQEEAVASLVLETAELVSQGLQMNQMAQLKR